MQATIVNAANALDAFAANMAGAWAEGSYHNVDSSWTTPPTSRQMIARRARRAAERIRSLSDSAIDEELVEILDEVPDQVQFMMSSTIPNMSGGFVAAISAINIYLSNLEQSLPEVVELDWEKIEASDTIPRDLARRLRGLESNISRLEPRVGSMDEKVKSINEAHAAALDLPTDLQQLKEAREELQSYATSSRSAARSVATFEADAKELVNKILSQKDESDRLVESIGTAYSAATTVGLASAFSERANSLHNSTRWWVGLLITALLFGGASGYFRLQSLQAALNAPGGNEHIWINVIMSVFAVAAPVWFAWLATRQISQRFRLAEDYAFKASVARAYEGFRKEAVRLDPKLEARLFASALDRLEEPPLRFLAVEEHSSPYEALLASPGFQRIIDKFPDVKDAVVSAIKNAKVAVDKRNEVGENLSSEAKPLKPLQEGAEGS